MEIRVFTLIELNPFRCRFGCNGGCIVNRCPDRLWMCKFANWVSAPRAHRLPTSVTAAGFRINIRSCDHIKIGALRLKAGLPPCSTSGPNETIKNTVILLQMTAFDSGADKAHTAAAMPHRRSEKVTRRTFNTLFDWLEPNWKFAIPSITLGNFIMCTLARTVHSREQTRVRAPIYYYNSFSSPNSIQLVCARLLLWLFPSRTLRTAVDCHQTGKYVRLQIERVRARVGVRIEAGQRPTTHHHRQHQSHHNNRLCVMNGFHSIATTPCVLIY